MSAHASPRVRDTRLRLVEIAGNRNWGTAIAATLLLSAAPAAAQVGSTISIFSDDRFRGFSLSDGHQVGILDLSYDAPNGFYAAVPGTMVESPKEGVRPLGLQLNGGYATQLTPDLTADVGIVHARYSHYSGLRSGLSYTEVYAGLEGRVLSSRFYFSPHYLGRGATTYAELNAQLPAGQQFTIEAHAGVFIPLYAYSHGGRSVSRYDWQVGLSRPMGRFILHAALSGGGPKQDYYGDYSSGHALTIGLDYAL